MANEFKVKKGLIVDGSNTVLDIQGTQGQLFSVTDSLTGDLFSVSDVSGIPILNVNSSGIVTVDGNIQLADNDKIQLGDSQDLELYHDGTNSYISDNGTGELRFIANGATRFKIGSDVASFSGTDFAIAAARKLYLDGQSNTYITESSADNIKFFTGGTEVLLLDSSQDATFAGNITGVTETLTGTTSLMLTLNPTANNYGGIWFKYGGASKGMSVYNSNNMVYGGEAGVGTILQTNGSHALNIDTAQNATFAGRLTFDDTANILLAASTLSTVQNFTKGSASGPSGQGHIQYRNFRDYPASNGNAKVLDIAATSGIFASTAHAASYIRFSTAAADTDTTEALLLGPDNTATFAGDVSLADSKKAIFGASQDLQIFHSGSHSYIQDVGTGSLYLQTNGSAIYLQDTDGNPMAQFTDGGGSFLMFNGNLKLSTTNTGIGVTGNIAVTGTTDGVYLDSYPDRPNQLTYQTLVAHFSQTAGSTSAFNIPMNNTTESTTATYYHFWTAPFNGRVKTMIMKHGHGTSPDLISSTPTKFGVAVNGTSADYISSSFLTRVRVEGRNDDYYSYIKDDDINETFNAGDRVYFQFINSSTSVRWRNCSVSIVVEYNIT